MWLCKQVAHALDDHRYWDLPWHRRLGLNLHVLLCFVCGRYHRHVMLMQRTAHDYVAHEQADLPAAGLSLSPEARDRIAKKISEPRL